MLQLLNDAATLPANVDAFWKFLVSSNPLVPWAVFALATIALVWSLWPNEEEDASEGIAPHAATVGASSPALAGSFRDVHFHAPHPTHEAAPPKRYNIGKLNDGIEKALVAQAARESLQPAPAPAPAPASLPEPVPDLLFKDVVARVYRKFGGVPEEEHRRKDFYDAVDREISKQVRLRALRVWGFAGKRGPDFLSMRTLEGGWFDHKQHAFFSPGDTVYPLKYEHLEFNRAQVEAAWPE